MQRMHRGPQVAACNCQSPVVNQHATVLHMITHSNTNKDVPGAKFHVQQSLGAARHLRPWTVQAPEVLGSDVFIIRLYPFKP
jgi:hypothetical protein